MLRPGGHVLVSTPEADWHYPYFGVMRKYCPHESELMQQPINASLICLLRRNGLSLRDTTHYGER